MSIVSSRLFGTIPYDLSYDYPELTTKSKLILAHLNFIVGLSYGIS